MTAKPHESPKCACEPCVEWWAELLCYADYCASMVLQAEFLFGIRREPGETIESLVARCDALIRRQVTLSETPCRDDGDELTLKELKKP
jgi:hypothetical protein